jgi:hypothetical protein
VDEVAADLGGQFDVVMPDPPDPEAAERPFDSAMVADLAVWSVKCSVVIN